MNNIYMYILVMALVTYAIRALPLVLINKQINNKFFRSFLYYIPYVTLSVMTFPAILHCTGNTTNAFIGFVVALLLAYMEKSLTTVALVSSISVYLASILM